MWAFCNSINLKKGEAAVSEGFVQIINDEGFEEKVLGHLGLCLVDFWAPWCGPCHAMAPVLESFAARNAGKIKVFKLDVDDNPKTAERYSVRSIPTLIFFRDGKPLRTYQGAMDQEALDDALREIQP